MKHLTQLIALIGFATLAIVITPKVQITSKKELSRIETVVHAEPQKVSTENKKPVIEPQIAPKVETEIKKPETPPVAPAPTPVPAGDCSLVYQYDWPQNVAYAVCMAESSGIYTKSNMNDHHGSCVGSYSLMQVGCFWYPYYGYSSADFYNPVVNMEIAYKIYKRQGGFGAWTAYTKGHYTKYLR